MWAMTICWIGYKILHHDFIRDQVLAFRDVYMYEGVGRPVYKLSRCMRSMVVSLTKLIKVNGAHGCVCTTNRRMDLGQLCHATLRAHMAGIYGWFRSGQLRFDEVTAFF